MGLAREQLMGELISSGYLKTPRIIAAFEAIDRKNFVLPEYSAEAYGNYPLPIGEGQTISQPLTVAFMLELLDPQPGEKILDVGYGSGWQTALLAHIIGKKGERQKMKDEGGGAVFAIERIPELCEFGKKNIAKYDFIGSGAVKMLCADATENISVEAPFDKIIAAAAIHGRDRPRPSAIGTDRALVASRELPAAWRNYLKIGGAVVAPIDGSIWRFTKRSENEWTEEEFPGFAFVPLVVNDKRQGTKDKKQETRNRKHETDRRVPTTPLTLFAAVMLAGFFCYALLAPFDTPSKTVTVEIPKGVGVKKIGILLEEKNIIRSRWLFFLWASLSRDAKKMREGTYQFSGNMSIPSVMRRLAAGELSQNERAITIPEGWDIGDIGAYLEKQNIATKSEFFKSVGIPRSFSHREVTAEKLRDRFPFLREIPSGMSFEGYLFPDTYRIFINASAEEIAAKMFANFEKKITEETQEEINRQNKTVFEIITMASLIEKEVAHEEDRATVSGILWKRLEIGMGLQVDATIAYVKQQETRNMEQETGKNRRQEKENREQIISMKISLADTEIDSPYNTYKYRGLPPGPIANPGLSAIRAAIFPNPSSYLYYLSASDGTTIFSKTLEEHNEAKVKYLK